MKKTFLMNFEDFMKKLHSIQWETCDRARKTIISRKENWELSYSIKETNVLHDKTFPLQVVVHVRFQGEVVQTWGCESNKDNAEFLTFFAKRESEATELDFQNRRETEKLGKTMWNNL